MLSVMILLSQRDIHSQRSEYKESCQRLTSSLDDFHTISSFCQMAVHPQQRGLASLSEMPV
jgi:hypothetical protein